MLCGRTPKEPESATGIRKRRSSVQGSLEMHDAVNTEECERSSAVIKLEDLERLSQLAREDLQGYIGNDPALRAPFAARILCVALCQGAARHYADKTTGVKDFDIFTFFAAEGAKKFPPRRRTCHDFGPSKFGRNHDDVEYTGRRVDVMGRSIAHSPEASAVDSLRYYLRTLPTGTAWHLAQKAVVLIDPIEHRGQIVWPELGRPTL